MTIAAAQPADLAAVNCDCFQAELKMTAKTVLNPAKLIFGNKFR